MNARVGLAIAALLTLALPREARGEACDSRPLNEAEKTFATKAASLKSVVMPAPKGWVLLEQSAQITDSVCDGDTAILRATLSAQYEREGYEHRQAEMFAKMQTAMQTTPAEEKKLAVLDAKIAKIQKDMTAAIERGDIAAAQKLQPEMQATIQEMQAIRMKGMNAITAESEAGTRNDHVRLEIELNADYWDSSCENPVQVKVEGAASAWRDCAGAPKATTTTVALFGPWESSTEDGYVRTAAKRKSAKYFDLVTARVELEGEPASVEPFLKALDAKKLRATLPAP